MTSPPADGARVGDSSCWPIDMQPPVVFSPGRWETAAGSHEAIADVVSFPSIQPCVHAAATVCPPDSTTEASHSS